MVLDNVLKRDNAIFEYIQRLHTIKSMDLGIMLQYTRNTQPFLYQGKKDAPSEYKMAKFWNNSGSRNNRGIIYF